MKDSPPLAQLAGTLVYLAAVLAFATATVSAAEKPRILVLTDIENEPETMPCH